MSGKSFMQEQQERAVQAMMAVCSVKADQWAEETKLIDLVNRMTNDEGTREVLMKYGKQCFSEGLFRGISIARGGE